MKKEKLKEEFIKLFLMGKSISDISKMTGWSRTYISNLIKNDKRIIEYKNTKKIKVYKRKDQKQFLLHIPTKMLENIGISHDLQKEDYVEIKYDKKSKSIIIKKA